MKYQVREALHIVQVCVCNGVVLPAAQQPVMLELFRVTADVCAAGALYRSHGLLHVYWHKVEQHRIMRYFTSAVNDSAYLSWR